MTNSSHTLIHFSRPLSIHNKRHFALNNGKVWLSSTCDSSKLSHVWKKIVTIPKSVSIIMTRIRDVHWVHTLLWYVSILRALSARTARHALKATIVLSLSIILRSTKQNSVTDGLPMWSLVNSAISVPLHIMKKSFRLIYSTRWSKTQISTCSISRQYGAHSTTKIEVTWGTSANMLTTGRTIDASHTCTSTWQGSSAAFGLLRRRQRLMQMGVILNTVVSIAMAGKSLNTILPITRFMSAIVI